MNTFEEFRADWFKRHPGSGISKPRVSSVGLIAGIALWGVIATGAAAVSGAHSIPAILLTIPQVIVSPYRELLSAAGFTIFELLIFAGALYRQVSRYALAALVLSVGGALFANIGSSVFAVQQSGGSVLDLGVSVALALVAPLAAFLAGEMVNKLTTDHQRIIADKVNEWQAKRKELDATINREYSKHVKVESGGKFPPVASVSTPKTPSKAVMDTVEFLRNHPEIATLSSREIAKRAEVSHTIVNQARKHIEHSNNGHTPKG